MHNKQIVEASAEVLGAGSIFAVGAALEFGVVAGNRDNVDRIKVLPKDRKELKTDRHESAMATMVGVGLKRIADIESHEATGPKHAIDFVDDPGHGAVVFGTPIGAAGVLFADAVGVVGIVDMRRVGRINKYKVTTGIGQRQVSCVGLENIGSVWDQIKALHGG